MGWRRKSDDDLNIEAFRAIGFVYRKDARITLLRWCSILLLLLRKHVTALAIENQDYHYLRFPFDGSGYCMSSLVFC